MKETHAPLIMIVVTVLLSLACYMLYDHSGIGITDLEIRSTGGDAYQVSYNLRLGKTFNNLESKHILYNKENQSISNTSSKIGNSSIWSIPRMENFTVNEDVSDKTPVKVEVIFYEQFNVTKPSELIYDKNYTFSA